MNVNGNIREELAGISAIVAGIDPRNPYQIPEGYFDAFSFQILHLIQAEQQGSRPEVSSSEELQSLSPVLASLTNKIPYQVPDTYFRGLEQETLQGIRAVDFVQDTINHPSVLSDAALKQMPYNVPQDYFAQLPLTVSNKVMRHAAPVMSGRIHWMRYAAAAALMGLIVLVSWFSWQAITLPAPSAETVQIDQHLKQLNDQEIEFYAKQWIPLASNDIAYDDETLSDQDMKDMLADFSDDELAQFEQSASGSNMLN
jgi:hypothetical protein